MLFITVLPHALVQSSHTIDLSVRISHVWGSEYGGPQGSNSNGRAGLAPPGARLLSDVLAPSPSLRVFGRKEGVSVGLADFAGQPTPLTPTAQSVSSRRQSPLACEVPAEGESWQLNPVNAAPFTIRMGRHESPFGRSETHSP